jgi:hypothetical protein
MTTVAIACQGGGSHAAFTAGVLGELLATHRDRCDLRALSGTSGGAVLRRRLDHRDAAGLTRRGRPRSAGRRDSESRLVESVA